MEEKKEGMNKPEKMSVEGAQKRYENSLARIKGIHFHTHHIQFLNL